MVLQTTSVNFPSLTFAQAYGAGVYSCGEYQNNTECATAVPGAPNTGAFLTEPSVVIPGSLALAIVLALITTTIAKFIRRKRRI